MVKPSHNNDESKDSTPNERDYEQTRTERLLDAVPGLTSPNKSDRRLARQMVTRFIPNVGSWARVAIFGVYLVAIAGVYPAMAQLSEVGSALCSSGLGQLVGYAIALYAAVLLIKVIFQVMGAMDKYQSPRSGEHEEGVNKMESAVWTFGAAVAPVLLAAFFDMAGIYTFSCINLNIGIFG